MIRQQTATATISSTANDMLTRRTHRRPRLLWRLECSLAVRSVSATSVLRFGDASYLHFIVMSASASGNKRSYYERLSEPKARQGPLCHLGHHTLELSSAVMGEAAPIIQTAGEAVAYLAKRRQER